MVLTIRSIFFFIYYAVTAIVVAASVLIVLRALFNYMEVNPFKWSVRTVRRVTDPVIMPLRRSLIGARIDPQFAPVVAILLFILMGYLAVLLIAGLLNTLAGILEALTLRGPGTAGAIAGYVIYGLLGLYTLLMLIRIVLSFGGVGYENRSMRFLIRITEPLLAPLRRTIPPVGLFDISPLVALLIIYILQQVVAGTLLKGWRLQFF
jgi:YggT family protein